MLVTGGAGFVGSHVASAHVRRGDEVVVLDDLSSGSRANVPREARLVEGSVTDLATVLAAADGVDAIQHLAALAAVQQCLAEPARAHAVNAGGTVNVLEAARRLDVGKVVVASTCAAYGNEPTLPKRESMAAQPVGPYAASKVAAEAYARGWFETYGLRTTAFRFFNVYGPRQPPDSQYAAVVPRFLAEAVAGRPLTIYGDGLQTRDFVYVTDVAEACARAATSRRADGELLNIASGRETSVLDLARAVVAATASRSAIRHEPARSGEVRRSVASIGRLREVLGEFEPTPLADGLAETAKALPR